MQWHSLSFKEAAKLLKTDIRSGLSEEEVKNRRKKFGMNRLPEEKTFSALRLFLEQFKSPLIYILLIAGVITLFLKEYTDSIVIFLAVFINAVFGFFEENKAFKTLRALKKILKVKAVVLREGNKKVVFQEEIVPGDIIILNAGDKVPADGRLIETKRLKVNESILTGEWIPTSKTNKILPENTPLADRDNMVYMGTIVEDGQGKAVVTETGKNTEIGKIASLVKETREEKTPLQKRLARFSKVIGMMIGVICFFLFFGGMIRGTDPLVMFEAAVAIAVGGIPEALPVVMTVILVIGMERILKNKGLVRRLSSVETLGSATVICTDKTKTLTEGKMEIGEIKAVNKKLALEIAVLTADAFIENPHLPVDKWVVRGSPTDRAIIIGAGELGVLKPELEKKIKIISHLPFDPSSKFLATLLEKDGALFLYVCGAPERLLELSKNKKPFLKTLDRLTEAGLRVIGTAYKKINKKGKKIEEEIKNLNFVGFIALKDPLRKGVKEAIKICENAGVKPIIITGDHKKTAKAVAQELGMEIEDENIIEGKDLDGMTDEELMKKVKEIKIYARAEPRHKIRIVNAWQSNGEVVAMVGDGVNDAPALKKADIGVAVGSGSEVAKETSDLILLNDSFSIIVKAIEQGRVILDNLRKSIAYILADSFTSTLLIGLSIIFGWPLPILPAQILWNNFVEDTLPDIAYAFEPKERGVMKRKVKHSKTLLTKEMKVLIFGTGLVDEILTFFLFWFLWGYLGMDLKYVRTMVFGAICIDTAFVIYCYKSLRKNIWRMDIFSNKILILSSLVVFIVFALAVYAPPLQILLKTVPLSILDWSILILIGVVSMALIEIPKWYFISKKEIEV